MTTIESNWTVDTLKTHFDQRFEAADAATKLALSAAKEAVTAALIAAEKAVDKQEVADEKRFKGQNEFREQLKDQANTLFPRREAELRLDGIQRQVTHHGEQIAEIRTSEATTKEHKSETWAWRAPVIVSIVSTIIAIVAMIATIFIATHHTTPATPVVTNTPAITKPAAIIFPAPIILQTPKNLVALTGNTKGG